MPTVKRLRSLTIDSNATAAINPSCCSEVERLRAPNIMPKIIKTMVKARAGVLFNEVCWTVPSVTIRVMPLSISKVTATAFIWRAIYGMIPTTAMMVTSAPSSWELPYLRLMRSAIDEILFTLLIRMIRLRTKNQEKATSVGPK